MAQAQWSTNRTDVISKTSAAGDFTLEAPLYDDGTKMLTLRIVVSADRHVRVYVLGEPDATLAGFDAWSDL